MAPQSRLLTRLLAALLLALFAHAAVADPPGRVGRLADLQGPVWLYDAESGEWVPAGRNRPLTGGDRVSTDSMARADLRIGSTTLRLAAGTEVELLQLDDDIIRVQLHNGLLALRLRSHEAARELELVTAEGRFKPDRAGRYRLDRVDATSSITVWSGQLLFEAPDNAATIVAGQRADIWNSGRTQYTLTQPQRDAFADEVAASELAEERSVSAKYVSPEMTGVEDLDRYGRWENDAEYGALWVPQAVEPGWAPYRFGHWTWVRPWGWTWVDDARWGFAPFHYGRWVYLRNAWRWAPGRWVARPVYAPALVAWVGAPQAGLSMSIGVGSSVGWFPLGPREVFVPGYRSSPHYVRNVNSTHVTNITNVTQIINSPNSVVGQANYINRGLPGAMTVVPATVVSGRQPVAPSRVQLTDPRPGAGGRHDMAALATVTASPPVQAPAPRHGNAAVQGQPGAPIAGGGAAARPTRPEAPPPAAVPAIVPPQAHRAVPPPPATQPEIRGQHRPATDAAMPLPGSGAPARQVPGAGAPARQMPLPAAAPLVPAPPATALPTPATPAAAPLVPATPATALPAPATPSTALPTPAVPARTAPPAPLPPAVARPTPATPATALPAPAMPATALPAPLNPAAATPPRPSPPAPPGARVAPPAAVPPLATPQPVPPGPVVAPQPAAPVPMAAPPPRRPPPPPEVMVPKPSPPTAQPPTRAAPLAPPVLPAPVAAPPAGQVAVPGVAPVAPKPAPPPRVREPKDEPREAGKAEK